MPVWEIIMSPATTCEWNENLYHRGVFFLMLSCSKIAWGWNLLMEGGPHDDSHCSLMHACGGSGSALKVLKWWFQVWLRSEGERQTQLPHNHMGFLICSGHWNEDMAILFILMDNDMKSLLSSFERWDFSFFHLFDCIIVLSFITHVRLRLLYFYIKFFIVVVFYLIFITRGNK